MEEERIGSVVHFYPKARAAEVRLERGSIHPGVTLHLKGHGVDRLERVERIEIDHKPVREAHAGQRIGIAVDVPIPKNTDVYLVRSEFPGEEY